MGLVNHNFNPHNARPHPERDNIVEPDGWWVEYDEGPHPELPEGMVAHAPETAFMDRWTYPEFAPGVPQEDDYSFKVYVRQSMVARLRGTLRPGFAGGVYDVVAEVWPKLHTLVPVGQGPPPEDEHSFRIGLQINAGEVLWISPVPFDGWSTVVWGDVEIQPGDEVRIWLLGKWAIDNSVFINAVWLEPGGGEPPVGPPSGDLALLLGRMASAQERIAASLEFLVSVTPGVPVPPDPPEPGPIPPEPPAGQMTAFSQNDPRWRDLVYAGNATFGRYGCLVVAWAMIASLREGAARVPPAIAVALRNAGAFDGALLSFPARGAEALPGLVWDGFRHWRDAPADLEFVAHWLANHGPLICEVKWDPTKPLVDQGRWNQHFVVAEALVDGGEDALIVDPWDGQRKHLVGSRYALPGWNAARTLYGARLLRLGEGSPPEPPETPETLFGLNVDREQVGELAGLGLGLAAVVAYVDDPLEIPAAPPGARLLVNLRRSWSVDLGGQGTLPAPGPWRARFIDNCVATIRQNGHVWGWSVGNEPNNPREDPPGYALRPQDVAEIYNAIRARCPGVRMSPGATDPYNAQKMDSGDWARAAWEEIDGAEWVEAHGYVRGPDPDLVGSPARFDDPPLQWLRLNFPGCVTDLVNRLPMAARGLPVYVTECNHIWRDGGEGDWGWVTDGRAVEVIRRCKVQAQAQALAGVAFYRWRGDEWRLDNKPDLVAAVVE